MSLINNPYNRRDPQQEETLAECEVCSDDLYRGYEAFEVEGLGVLCCSEECALKAVGVREVTVGE